MAKRRTSQDPRKELWKLVAGMGSLSEALKSLELIKETEPLNIEFLSRQLWCSFFICYSRPFTNNNDIGILKIKILPSEYRDFHQKILKMRNVAYGHIDPLQRTAEDNQVNMIKVTVQSDGRVIPRPQGIEPHPSELERFYNHTNKVFEVISKEVSDYSSKHDIPEFSQVGDHVFDYTK